MCVGWTLGFIKHLFVVAASPLGAHTFFIFFNLH